MDIKEIAKVEIDNYIRIGNQHIFIQMNADDFMEHIRDISTKKNQRIHIFELNPLCIPTILSETIKIVQDDTKIVIHVPKMVGDFSVLLSEELNGVKGRWKIVTERGPINFTYRGKFGKEKMYVGFHEDNTGYRINVYIDKLSFKLPISFYNSKGTNAFMTVPQWERPELFKIKILRNFRKCTPKGILAGFKDDEDIWDFLMEEWTNAKRRYGSTSSDVMPADNSSDCEFDSEEA